MYTPATTCSKKSQSKLFILPHSKKIIREFVQLTQSFRPGRMNLQYKILKGLLAISRFQAPDRIKTKFD